MKFKQNDTPDFETAYKKAAELCSKSEKCRFEIRTKLNSWGVQAGETETIIEKLIQQKFIDENRFANAYANDKFKYNKWGKNKIRAYLKALEIDGLLIQKAVNNISVSEYKTTAKKLISDKAKSIKEENLFQKKAKIMNFMMSKGFESELIMEIIEKM